MNSSFLMGSSNPDAQLRLFCLPYAGGGASRYFRWMSRFPREIEVCPLLLPGREGRLNEQPFASMGSLVATLAEELAPLLQRPFAIFGHSMGALIGFELTRQIRREFSVSPSRLLVSGCRAPHIPPVDPILHSLPPDQFRERIRQLQDVPTEAMENDEYMKLILPTLRADLQLCETYAHTAETPLRCAISVLGGLFDRRVKEQDLAAWQRHTTVGFTVHMFPGGHLFLNDCEAAVTRSIIHDLSYQPETK